MGQGFSLCFKEQNVKCTLAPSYMRNCDNSFSLGGGAADDDGVVGDDGVVVVGADVVDVVVGADGAVVDVIGVGAVVGDVVGDVVDVVGADDVVAAVDVVGADVGAGAVVDGVVGAAVGVVGAVDGVVGDDDVVVGADGGNVGADSADVGADADGADVPLAFKKSQLISELQRNPPSDPALKAVMKCVHRSVHDFKPDVVLLVALYKSTGDHVLHCIIADIFHRRRIEKQLGALPPDYKPPHRQVRNKEIGLPKSGKKSKEITGCNICGNRRGGDCHCCTTCCRINGSCTCEQDKLK
jgi:hypothetical protein